jgi:hypothetical protein
VINDSGTVNRVMGTLMASLRTLVAVVAIMAAAGAVAHPPVTQPLPLLAPAIVAYRWVFVAPHWVVAPASVDARLPVPSTRTKRIDYGVVEMTTERRRVGRIADFSCKYPDFALPNQCTTTWRNVYVDVPVPVVRRDHIDVDIPEWSVRNVRTTVDVPRLEWRREELIVSLPAIAVVAPQDP